MCRINDDNEIRLLKANLRVHESLLVLEHKFKNLPGFSHANDLASHDAWRTEGGSECIA